MSVAYKRLVRDTLVEDSTMRGFLNVTTTGSAPVSPLFMEQTGRYPQIIYSLTDGGADPAMDSTNGILTFMIQAQATGGINPHQTLGDIDNRISGLFCDLSLSGEGVSGTAVHNFLSIREGGLEVSYNAERKIYQKILTYSYKITGG